MSQFDEELRQLEATKKQRKSFELFRLGLNNVQVISYDELFGKVEFLVNLLEGNVTE